MLLTDVEIVDFKNIQEARLEFSPAVNCLLGKNGQGKSNLLEAVYFLSMARGLTSMPESALIRHGADMLMVKGNYEGDAGNMETVSCGIVRGKGKTLKRNGKEYSRLSEHIGRFPVVSVLPSDSELVSSGGEVRRRLMDIVISQCDNAYLSNLIRYNRALESRNKMLRAGVRDALLYESVESGMCLAADAVSKARAEWTALIKEPLVQYYRRISDDAERVSLTYRSVLSDRPLAETLAQTRAKDTVLGYTSAGVHRDDLATGLGDYSMRRLGSQGQVKSFTIALKLAIFDHLRQHTGKVPMLLLDDIFDKLDSGRVSRIMEIVSGGEFGQIFITDTNREHLGETLQSLKSDSRLLEVVNGEFKSLA